MWQCDTGARKSTRKRRINRLAHSGGWEWHLGILTLYSSTPIRLSAPIWFFNFLFSRQQFHGPTTWAHRIPYTIHPIESNWKRWQQSSPCGKIYEYVAREAKTLFNMVGLSIYGMLPKESVLSNMGYMKKKIISNFHLMQVNARKCVHIYIYLYNHLFEIKTFDSICDFRLFPDRSLVLFTQLPIEFTNRINRVSRIEYWIYLHFHFEKLLKICNSK